MPNNNWISVEDKLPVENQWIIAYFRDGFTDVSKLMPSGNFVGALIHGRITHWQPLPVPPSKDKPYESPSVEFEEVRENAEIC